MEELIGTVMIFRSGTVNGTVAPPASMSTLKLCWQIPTDMTGEGSRVNVALVVCLACFPMVVADTRYSSLARPCLEVNEPGTFGRLIRKLKGILRTLVT